MKLHLLRHGKTERTAFSGRDFDRELLPKGIKQCDLMREFLKSSQIPNVWVSSANRTVQTADLVLSSNQALPIITDELYMASRDMITTKLWSSNIEGDLLIIGHNFGISDLAEYFTETDVELRTCGYVCIEFGTRNWNETSKGLGVIARHYRPEVSL